MAAGMRDGDGFPIAVSRRNLAGIGQTSRLLHRQSVHIRPQHDDWPIAVAQYAEDARLPDAGRHIVASGADPLRRQMRCPGLLHREFGMRVKVFVERLQVWKHRREIRQDGRHGGLCAHHALLTVRKRLATIPSSSEALPRRVLRESVARPPPKSKTAMPSAQEARHPSRLATVLAGAVRATERLPAVAVPPARATASAAGASAAGAATSAAIATAALARAAITIAATTAVAAGAWASAPGRTISFEFLGGRHLAAERCPARE